MIIGSIVVSVLAVGGLIAALILNGGTDDDKPEGSGSASPSVVEGHRGPDRTKVIDTEKCTEPVESYNDPDKVELPDFTYKNYESVRACARAAGWQVERKDVDENTFGQDTVMEQFPTAGTDIDPENPPKITLNVSTGNPA